MQRNDNNKANNSLGGGAINEKERQLLDSDAEFYDSLSTKQYNPTNNTSHLLHALVGLDRYPNYLSRWNGNMKDVDELEQALAKSLEEVRRQKNDILSKKENLSQLLENVQQTDETMKELKEMPKSWESLQNILHKKAYKAISSSKILKSQKVSPLDVLSGKISLELEDYMLEEWLNDEEQDTSYYNVFNFEVFSKEFCQKIIHYIKQVTANNEAIGQRPIDLDMVGLSWINNLLFYLIVKPLATKLSLVQEEALTSSIDWRQGFVAGYSPNNLLSTKSALTRTHLVPHTDDAEITLNLCLSTDFEGGTLQFNGMRGSMNEGVEDGTYKHTQGRALLHAGRHLHLVNEVVEGERFVLIVWFRSWSGVRSFRCPCCWLNRRTGDDGANCICDVRWN